MHTLTKEEFEQQAEPLLRQVFKGNDETEPFVPHVEDRLLLYFPLGGNLERNHYWEKQLAEAISQAAQSISDTGCYLASSWEANITTYGGSPKNRYAYIPISELVEALTSSSNQVWKQLNILEGLGFCLCSNTGSWGLLTTVDEYAFLGGTHEFMRVVRQVFPDIEEEVVEFLHDVRLEQMYEEGTNVEWLDWLKQVLTHVYGSSKAQQLIANSGLV